MVLGLPFQTQILSLGSRFSAQSIALSPFQTCPRHPKTAETHHLRLLSTEKSLPACLRLSMPHERETSFSRRICARFKQKLKDLFP
jgi:hypothetical protein